MLSIIHRIGFILVFSNVGPSIRFLPKQHFGLHTLKGTIFSRIPHNFYKKLRSYSSLSFWGILEMVSGKFLHGKLPRKGNR